jgi:hypothetical protein
MLRIILNERPADLRVPAPAKFAQPQDRQGARSCGVTVDSAARRRGDRVRVARPARRR